MEDQTRTLARLGVEAAGLQIEADRVRRAYDDQIQPLERQLRLLQQSADLQRVQNALATNRAAVERLRLEREILALRQAAGGREDPAAEGLTLRQRLIALALQEQTLRQEELGLEDERRPLHPAAPEQQIARLQEQQRKALEPLERGLALRKEEVDAINLVRKQEELLAARRRGHREDAHGRAGRARTPAPWTRCRKRGEELADVLAHGLAGRGSTPTGAASGRPWARASRRGTRRPASPWPMPVGTDLGTAIGRARPGRPRPGTPSGRTCGAVLGRAGVERRSSTPGRAASPPARATPPTVSGPAGPAGAPGAAATRRSPSTWAEAMANAARLPAAPAGRLHPVLGAVHPGRGRHRPRRPQDGAGAGR